MTLPAQKGHILRRNNCSIIKEYLLTLKTFGRTVSLIMDSANCGNDSCAEYLALLQKRLECYFDVAKNKVYGGMTYDFAASYSSRENQTLLSKDAVMDYLDTKELCLVCTAMDLSSLKEQLDSLPAFAISKWELSRHISLLPVTVAFVEQQAARKKKLI